MNSSRQATAILLGAILIAYFNSLWGAFQYDDYNVIVNYEPVHTWQSWLADLPHGIRPLLKFTYTLNWNIGLGLLGFHLFNLACHVISTLLVFRLGQFLVKRQDQQEVDSQESLVTIPFIAAMLFALHPVQIEAVTYICSRSTSLMSLCYLGSIYCYHSAGRSGKMALYTTLSLALFLLAVASKETAVTLPLALILWDAANPQWPGWSKVIRRQAGHWLVLAGLGMILLLHPRYGWLLEVSIKTRSLTDNLLTQVNGISYLLTRLVMPHRLNIDPDLPVINSLSPTVAAEAALFAGLLLLGIFWLRRRPLYGFAILWFFLQLLPTNSVLPRLDVANERQLYLAGWGVFLIVGCLTVRLAESVQPAWRRRLPYLLGAIAIVLALLTIGRNHVYRSEVALWEATVKLSPNKARVHNNLGYAYLLAGRNHEARASFQTALQLQPGFAKARGNLADAEHCLKQEQLLRRQGIPWTPPYRSE